MFNDILVSTQQGPSFFHNHQINLIATFPWSLSQQQAAASNLSKREKRRADGRIVAVIVSMTCILASETARKSVATNTG